MVVGVAVFKGVFSFIFLLFFFPEVGEHRREESVTCWHERTSSIVGSGGIGVWNVIGC